ncbi:tigger transposable element-derived protein 2-like [Centruroides sculpturatus]|uniref:tigger transposable element-derived protein 2-like n=1 Tax=Centruroides sculpturatus TaxID=218467 RepID=UPI000C6D19C9|nr:tigger transposable element-derived protein 2-like [Centruroides sculpturatus]
MAPKKEKSDSENRKRFSVALKKEIIAKYENGIRVSDIAKEYNMTKLTISTIIKNKKAFKAVNVISKQRSKVLDEVEKLLLMWINEKQLAGDSVSEAIICEKAKNLYNDLLIQTPSTSADRQDFNVSRGWFDRFRRQTGIHSIIRHGEASSSDEKAAKAFVDEFAEFLKSEGYVWNQVFNCDETGLFQKRPVSSYLDEYWLTEVFAPTVKNYLQEMDLPLRCLLLMDNAPAHPPNLDDDLDSEHDFIKVKFLPPNTTPLLQPMDQQVISNFKKPYTKALFTMCFQVTNDTDLTLRAF